PENLSAAEPQPQGIGEVSRITGVFFEPKNAFQDIGRKPTFLIPLILIILVNVGFTVLLSQRVGWERVIHQQTELNPRPQQQMANLSPEQRERAAAVQQKVAPIIGYAGSIVGTPLWYLILAALLLGIVRGIMSVPLTLKQIYAVVVYSALPTVLQTVLKGV